jgi:hypothetical protein
MALKVRNNEGILKPRDTIYEYIYRVISLRNLIFLSSSHSLTHHLYSPYQSPNQHSLLYKTFPSQNPKSVKMQFFAIAAIFAGAVMASPTPGLNLVCPPGLYSNAQCCGTGVLDLLRLDCSTRENIPP